jgi:hypothetical protein
VHDKQWVWPKTTVPGTPHASVSLFCEAGVAALCVVRIGMTDGGVGHSEWCLAHHMKLVF